MSRAARRLGRRLRGAVRLAVASACALAAAAGPAAADEQPPILRAYNLDWIERVRPEAWAPPAERPVVCLLDTGVNVTPDTPADHPDGPIVARLAIDGGSGEAQGTSPLHLHGTQMASIIAAPRNDWGTVGVFPGARIVSVRVTLRDEVYITPADMHKGVVACTIWAMDHRARVSVVAMAESLYDQREADLPIWDLAARKAAEVDALFVAAIGNQPNAQVVAPLATELAIAVGAGDPAGEPCGFSPPLPQRSLLGPGCDASTRMWPRGSSSATAVTAALVAALAARYPSLSAEERAAAVLSSSAITTTANLRLDGIGVRDWFPDLVDQPAQLDGPVGAAPVVVRVPEPSPKARLLLWKPKIVAEIRARRLRVRRLTHKRAGRLVVEFRDRGKVRVISSRGYSVSTRVNGRPARVRAWIESAQPGQWQSLSVRAGVRSQ